MTSNLNKSTNFGIQIYVLTKSSYCQRTLIILPKTFPKMLFPSTFVLFFYNFVMPSFVLSDKHPGVFLCISPNFWGPNVSSLLFHWAKHPQKMTSYNWHKASTVEACTSQNFGISSEPASKAFCPSTKHMFKYVTHYPPQPNFLLFQPKWWPIYLKSALTIITSTRFILMHKCQ
jgi:hypothetical protein